jgi:hypothetical protein
VQLDYDAGLQRVGSIWYSLTSDGINNTFASAVSLGTVSCGASVNRSGTTFPAGTEDWFVFTWSPGATPCRQVTVTFLLSSGIQGDINTDATTTVASSVTPPVVLTTAGTFYVRIHGATSGDTGTWQIAISVT